MKLSKKTTKALCATPRKLVMFRWPESHIEPKEDRKYALAGTRIRFRVSTVVCNDGVFDVAAIAVDDPVRLMPIGVGDYEEDPNSSRIMRNGREPEPEAVGDDYLKRYSDEAKEKIADKMALVDAAHAAAEQLRREVPEVRREAWQMQTRANAARLKLNHKRGTLDFA